MQYGSGRGGFWYEETHFWVCSVEPVQHLTQWFMNQVNWKQCNVFVIHLDENHNSSFSLQWWNQRLYRMWCLEVSYHKLSEEVDCINSSYRCSSSQTQKNLLKETVHIFCGRKRDEWSNQKCSSEKS